MSQDSIGKRIKQVMDEAGLTTTEFSNKLGVQRSGLSHVFNGRNRPGLDLILRVVKVFPEVGYEWLLEGKQNVAKRVDTAVTQNEDVDSKDQKEVTDVTINKGLFEDTEPEQLPGSDTNVTKEEPQGAYHTSKVKDKTPNKQHGNFGSDQKKAVKIIVLYDDGTFEDFLTPGV